MLSPLFSFFLSTSIFVFSLVCMVGR
jgi:hypothetical protein